MWEETQEMWEEMERFFIPFLIIFDHLCAVKNICETIKRINRMNKKVEQDRKMVGLMDIFLTLDPQTFRSVSQSLSQLFTANKKGFNELLERFEEHKGMKLDDYDVSTIQKKRFIRDKAVNRQLSQILCLFWDGETKYHGGYLKCMLPTRMDGEPEESYVKRRTEILDKLTSLYMPVLDDCNYFCQPLWMNK